MKPLSQEQYQAFVDTSTVLERDGRGIKVLRTADGLIVKLFRLKSVFSSAVLKSYAERFIENSELLKQRGIKTVDVQEIYYCRPIKRTLIVYSPLPGCSLRDFLRKNENTREIMLMFTRLLAELHEKGILFRSVHFNNIIVSEDRDSLGLIDIADMRFKETRLSISERVRNFKHMLRYQEDCESLEKFGVSEFLENYMQVSKMAVSNRGPFLKKLQNNVPLFDQQRQGGASE